MEYVHAALREMLGPGAGIGVTDPTIGGELWPEEALAVSRAVPKRQIEFAAGRRAARAALEGLGHPPAAVPQGADRAPVWPVGITGSISHCAGCCVAVAARDVDYRTLGVDVEPAIPLDTDLIPIICTSAEKAWVATQANPGIAAKLIFSAKEAVYKAQYSLTGKVIGFKALTVNVSGNRFVVAAQSTLADIRGAILIREGLILSVAHA